MSYPAQNTDTEFQALVEEIKVLRKELDEIGRVSVYFRSKDRLLESFSGRRLKEVFDE
jgi:hypothetical protein